MKIVDLSRKGCPRLEGFNDCEIIIRMENYRILFQQYTFIDEKTAEIRNHLNEELKSRNIKLICWEDYKNLEKNPTNFKEWIVFLSENNAGAIECLSLIINHYANNFTSKYSLEKVFSILKEMKLKGKYLYMLYNDCCTKDIAKLFRIIDLMIYGEITFNDIEEKILSQPRGLGFDKFLTKIDDIKITRKENNKL